MGTSTVDLTTKNTYYAVATNIFTGSVNINVWQPTDYRLTYVLHSAAAPTDDTESPICRDWSIPISSSVAIDVYMKCVKDLGNVIIFA
jgi:hypothetical protein